MDNLKQMLQGLLPSTQEGIIQDMADNGIYNIEDLSPSEKARLEHRVEFAKSLQITLALAKIARGK